MERKDKLSYPSDFKRLHYMVRINCLTYNQAQYIEDAMDGFCIQETDFPFVALIIDDASTDGEPEIIKAYLEEHFQLNDRVCARMWETDDGHFIYARHKKNKNCYFAVILLKYNFYSIRKTKKNLCDQWLDNMKYIATCEGDDYWIKPNKLQRQVDFLESHADYNMVCCRAKRFSMKDNTFQQKDNFCRHGDGDLGPKDIIRRGGYYVPTCSMIYKADVWKKEYPEYCKKSPVGDYPFQIWMAILGKVYYFDEPMALYRVDNPSAWSGKKDALKSYSEKELDAFQRQIDMLKGFAKDFPLYAKPCIRRAEFFINSKFRSCHAKDPENQKILTYFKEDVKQFGILGRIDKRMRLCGNKYVLTLYYGTAFKWLFRNYLDLFW